MALGQGKNGSKSVQSAIDAAKPLDSFNVAGLPTAAAYANRIVRVTNGNAGAECLAFSNGTNWKVIALGSAPSAT